MDNSLAGKDSMPLRSALLVSFGLTQNSGGERTPTLGKVSGDLSQAINDRPCLTRQNDGKKAV